MALTSNNVSSILKTAVALLKERVHQLEEVLREGEVLKNEDTFWELARAKRNYLLKSTDRTVTPGSTLDQAQWAAYRQILRDLPQTYEAFGPSSVVCPTQLSVLGTNTNIE